jgi:hypothetical protein
VPLDNCKLRIQHPIASREVGLFKVQYQNSTNMNFENMKTGDQISSADGSLVVAFANFDAENGVIYFNVTDRLSKETDTLGFRI